MRNHTFVHKRIMMCFGPALLLLTLVWSAAAQTTTYSALTETQDSTWNRSTRVQQTRVEGNGRTIDTQVLERPSINGGYAVATATETETIHVGPNTVRVVERWYVPDADGRRRLSRIIEAETTTLPGRSTTTTRIRYDSDLDGHLQAMERDIEESIPLNASSNQTTSTILLLLGGVFIPVQKTVTVETRNGNGITDVQRTVSLGDHTGHAIIPTLVTHTVEEQTGNVGSRTKEERVLRADTGKTPGEGQMLPVERTVTLEWSSPDGEEHSRAETSLMFTIGVAHDGELHMNRQVSTVRQVMADGSTQIVQGVAEINPGAKSDRPRSIEKKTEISRRGAAGQFETSTVVEAPNSSGAMRPFWRSNTRGFNRSND